MKKYLFIFKFELMSNLQYIKNILTSFVIYFMMLFIFLNLWKYIYSDPSEIINGYTLNQMIWYVIAAEVLWGTLSGRKLCKEISPNKTVEGSIVGTLFGTIAGVTFYMLLIGGRSIWIVILFLVMEEY